MLSIHLPRPTEGVFKIAYGKVGGTELRLILIAGNLLLLVHPYVQVTGRAWTLYDAAGMAAIVAMAVTLLASTARSTRRLYELERLDGPRADAGPRPS
jgi:hypothetical protein